MFFKKKVLLSIYETRLYLSCSLKILLISTDLFKKKCYHYIVGMLHMKVCRLCLTKSPVSFSILENSVNEMLEALTSKKVNLEDDTSTIVCIKCLLNLKLAYNFQQKVKKCEDKLKEKLTLSLKIKQEPFSIQTESVTIDETGIVKSDNETLEDVVKLSDNNTCIICGIYIDDNLMNSHIREHLNNLGKCEFCDVSFSNFHSYRKHLLKHPESTTHKCKQCGAKFQYKFFYEAHIKICCNNREKIVVDPLQKRIAALGLQSKKAIKVLLDSKVKRKKTDIMDQINDEGAKKKIFKLGICSSKAIKVLLQTDQKNETYNCKTCTKTFANKKTLQAHTHKTKICEVCNRKISEYAYKRHLEDHALGTQVCHLCGATLQNKSSLVTHIFYSHNNLRYKCDHCEKLFKKKNARDLHIRKDHLGKPTHYCDTCGKGFYTGKFLDKHIKMKHLKLRPHKCDFCDKGFSSRCALKTHRRQHTNETPYKCEICGEGFRQNVSLKAHRKSKHNIIEPTTCDCKVCGKGFASDVALYAHMRLHQ